MKFLILPLQKKVKSWSKAGVCSCKLLLEVLTYKYLWPEGIWLSSSVDLGYTCSFHCNGLKKGKLGKIITVLLLVLLQQFFIVWWTLAEQINLIWGFLALSSYNPLNNFLSKHKALDKDSRFALHIHSYFFLLFFIYIQYTKFGYDWFASSLQRDRRNFLHVDFHYAWNARGAMHNLIKSSSRKLGIFHFF